MPMQGNKPIWANNRLLGNIIYGIGAGMAGQSAAPYFAHQSQMLAQQRQTQAQQAQEAQVKNATVDWLNNNGHTELAGMVSQGMISGADAIREARKPQKAPESYQDAFGVHRDKTTGEPLPGQMSGNAAAAGGAPQTPQAVQMQLNQQKIEEAERAKQNKLRTGQDQALRTIQRVDRAQGTLDDAELDTFGEVANPLNWLGLAGDKNSALGFPGLLNSWIRGSNARDFRADLETIRSNLGFDKLQQLRDNSPTGGAVGQVSNFENLLMQAVVANLDTAQSQAQLEENLQIIRDLYRDIYNGTSTMESLADYESRITKAGGSVTDAGETKRYRFNPQTGQIE